MGLEQTCELVLSWAAMLGHRGLGHRMVIELGRGRVSSAVVDLGLVIESGRSVGNVVDVAGPLLVSWGLGLVIELARRVV